MDLDWGVPSIQNLSTYIYEIQAAEHIQKENKIL